MSWLLNGLRSWTVVLLLGTFLRPCMICSPMVGTPTLKVGQEEATQVVWRETYHRRGSAPLILWVDGFLLSCKMPSGKLGFPTWIGCREGFTVLPWVTQVAWREGDRFEDTTFSHELKHSAQSRDWIFDPFHHTPDFWSLDQCVATVPDPACGSVDAANLKLAEVGQ